tara:strand:+ start:642 stop:881 length:240 start_codon:yes stop_codon:yes gene_type:complete
MEIQDQSESGNKLKIDEKEYLIETLPEKTKQILAGLRTADVQTNIYRDTLRLIEISKTKMIEDLKVELKNVEPIPDTNN